MPNPPAVSDISQADYEAIEAAVMETARGRWFLAEFARRNRHADTEVLLASIGRLEQTMTEQKSRIGVDRFKVDLVEMSTAIAETRTQLTSMRDPSAAGSGSMSEASHELDAIIRTTEAATSDILTATEAIQDTAWTMREKGVPPALCDAIDEQATNIYTACSFQDLTAQRTAKVVDVLHYLETRIKTMIDIWGFGKETETASGNWQMESPLDDDLDDHLSQSDIDFILVEKPKAEAEQPERKAPKPVAEALPPVSVPRPAKPKPAKRPHDEMLEKVDKLSESEKNRLFV